jgi:hypothetical protein
LLACQCETVWALIGFSHLPSKIAQTSYWYFFYQNVHTYITPLLTA